MKNHGIKRKKWWALVRSPKSLPVIFATRKQARENKEPDEYIVPVFVTARFVRDHRP